MDETDGEHDDETEGETDALGDTVGQTKLSTAKVCVAAAVSVKFASVTFISLRSSKFVLMARLTQQESMRFQYTTRSRL